MDTKDLEFLTRVEEQREPLTARSFARLAKIVRDLIGEVEARNSYEDEQARGDDN